MNKIAEHFAVIAEKKKAEFPLDIFPEQVKTIIEHYSKFRSYPMDFFAVSILTAVGSAIGNSYVLKTPDGYINRANLYLMLVASPGLNKSAPLTEAFKPILEKQAVMFKEWRENQSKGNEKESKRKDANTNKTTDNQLIENQKEEKEEKERTEIFFIKPILSDCTTEALIMQLSHNAKGVTILYDEIAGFLNSFNRYSKGNDVQLFLELWQGTHISRDTIKSGTTEVPNPFVSIIGTIQPGELEKSFADKLDNGLLDRFLICYLNDLKKPYPHDKNVNPAIEHQYRDLINTLSELYFNDTVLLNYSDDGYRIIYDWVRKSIDIENNHNTTDTMRGIRAKMIIYIHRFALIMQMMEYGISQDFKDKEFVNTKACIAAVALADYFMLMAEKTRLKAPYELLTGQLKELFDRLPEEIEFKTSEYLEFCTFLEIDKRTARNILKRNLNKLWIKVKHGVYTKIV